MKFKAEVQVNLPKIWIKINQSNTQTRAWKPQKSQRSLEKERVIRTQREAENQKANSSMAWTEENQKAICPLAWRKVES